jgi:farnesyl-diphosphate farnesyltransferase
VLHAFRLDAVKLRYEGWDDLMAYCRYSASPVGRQLLDLHGQTPDTWPASDALCSALQVLNHLQDCADDYQRLDRVYLPLPDLATEGIGVEALTAGASSRALRRVLDRLLDQTAVLVEKARDLPSRVAAPGLRWECGVIVELAGRLLLRLRRGDPLAARVRLHRSDFLAALLIGVAGNLRR